MGVNYVRNREAAAEVVREIEQAGGKAIALQADVGQAADRARLLTELLAALGRRGCFGE